MPRGGVDGKAEERELNDRDEDHRSEGEAVAQLRTNSELDWTLAAPSLEDVFIDLMSRSQDNFR